MDVRSFPASAARPLLSCLQPLPCLSQQLIAALGMQKKKKKMKPNSFPTFVNRRENNEDKRRHGSCN